MAVQSQFRRMAGQTWKTIQLQPQVFMHKQFVGCKRFQGQAKDFWALRWIGNRLKKKPSNKKLVKRWVFNDNENKMVSMRKVVYQALRYVLPYGFNAHYLNLLEEAVTPSSVIAHVREIHIFLRNHHRPHSWLKNKYGKTTQLDIATRWNSQLRLFRNFRNQFQAL